MRPKSRLSCFLTLDFCEKIVKLQVEFHTFCIRSTDILYGSMGHNLSGIAHCIVALIWVSIEYLFTGKLDICRILWLTDVKSVNIPRYSNIIVRVFVTVSNKELSFVLSISNSKLLHYYFNNVKDGNVI